MRQEQKSSTDKEESLLFILARIEWEKSRKTHYLYRWGMRLPIETFARYPMEKQSAAGSVIKLIEALQNCSRFNWGNWMIDNLNRFQWIPQLTPHRGVLWWQIERLKWINCICTGARKLGEQSYIRSRSALFTGWGQAPPASILTQRESEKQKERRKKEKERKRERLYQELPPPAGEKYFG